MPREISPRTRPPPSHLFALFEQNNGYKAGESWLSGCRSARDFDPGDSPEGGSDATLSRYRRPGGRASLLFPAPESFGAGLFPVSFLSNHIYLAFLIPLFYMEDRWAYMIGMRAPAAWLVMAFATGMLGAAIRQLFRVSEGAGMINLISLVAGITAILS